MNILRSPWLYLVAFMAFSVYSWHIVENGQNHVLREQNHELTQKVKSLEAHEEARMKLAGELRVKLTCSFTDPDVTTKIDRIFADHYNVPFNGTFPSKKEVQKSEQALIKSGADNK